jgi:hypothetical protein
MAIITSHKNNLISEQVLSIIPCITTITYYYIQNIVFDNLQTISCILIMVVPRKRCVFICLKTRFTAAGKTPCLLEIVRFLFFNLYFVYARVLVGSDTKILRIALHYNIISLLQSFISILRKNYSRDQKRLLWFRFVQIIIARYPGSAV